MADVEKVEQTTVNNGGTEASPSTKRTHDRSGRVLPTKGPHVYFIQAGDAVKIGFSETVTKRFAGIQSNHPAELELLGTVPASADTERAYHERFAHLRIRGEWYRADQELLDAIESDCSGARPLGKPDYAEVYEKFQSDTKHLCTPGNARMVFARTQVLFRLRQLVENRRVPLDMRESHLSVHLEGLKDAMGIFERAMASH